MNMTLYIIHKLIVNATGFLPDILFDNMVGIEACDQNIIESCKMILKLNWSLFYDDV